MANSVDPDQTAPMFWVHTVCFYAQFVSYVRQIFASDDFSRQHFQMHFFLGGLMFNKKNYNMKYHVILGRFKWLINVSPSLEGIRYPRSVYVLSFVCFFLLLLLFLYSLEKQFGWFLTHISRLHI